jgi:hypothetical protein
MKLAWITAAFLFLASVVAVEAEHDLGYKWGGNRVGSLTVYDNTTTPALTQTVATAVANWNASSVVEMSIVREPGPCQYGRHRNAVTVCEYTSDVGCWVGVANIAYGKNNQIQQAHVGLQFECDGVPHDSSFLLLAACQEIGHVLGLDHPHDGEPTCMNSSASFPNAHDFEQLEAIY